VCRLNLPRSLRIKVADANYGDIIDHCAMVGRPFSGCKPRFFNALMIILKPVHLIPGDTIVFKEEVPRELYFVYQGALRVVLIRLSSCFSSHECYLIRAYKSCRWMIMNE
jgi:hypothetical protein